MGIPDDVLAAMNMPPPQMQAPGGQPPAGQGNGMNPASNPAPEPASPEGGMQ